MSTGFCDREAGLIQSTCPNKKFETELHSERRLRGRKEIEVGSEKEEATTKAARDRVLKADWG